MRVLFRSVVPLGTCNLATKNFYFRFMHFVVHSVAHHPIFRLEFFGRELMGVFMIVLQSKYVVEGVAAQ